MNSNIITYVRIKSSKTKPVSGKGHIKILDRIYHADKILHGSDQEELFRSMLGSILEKCVQGYNCSIFAYGQTGSGKTYTIQGNGSEPGLVPRSLRFLHGIYDSIRLSFIEIYNENMIDLLDPENGINIRDDPVEGVTIDNLNIASSRSIEESLLLYERGVCNRKTTATQMNDSSSRSHSIFTVFLEFKDRNIIKKSKLCFVDLAGSEKCKDVGAERIKETCNINKSLLCLGKIVHKLSSNEKWHISYRDSKLTFLLKDSLGGNSKLAIIGNISLEHPSDSVNTLQFLQRSKMISNKPSINYDTARSSIEELTENLKRLDEDNQALKDEVALLKREQEHSVKSSLMFFIRKLKSDLEDVKTGFLTLKKGMTGVVECYFDDNKRAILEISENIALINENRKENIKNIQIKRRKVED